MLPYTSCPGQEGPRPLGQGLAGMGGGVDTPWIVFISQKMPQMPEAQAGVRRSPCAAVTNIALPSSCHPLSSPPFPYS